MKRLLVGALLLPTSLCANSLGLKPLTHREEKIVRICACVGTHATGKTTSSYMIAQSFKMQKMNAIAVAESVREAPVGFNKGHTADTTEWVASHQKCKEITCKAQGYEMMVTDRSILDSLVYHRALKLPWMKPI